MGLNVRAFVILHLWSSNRTDPNWMNFLNGIDLYQLVPLQWPII